MILLLLSYTWNLRGLYSIMFYRGMKETITVHADFFLGSDGAHSQARRFLQRYTL